MAGSIVEPNHGKRGAYAPSELNVIFMEGLTLDARIGIYPHERLASQLLEIDLAFGMPDAASARDNIADTIDYETVASRIAEFAMQRQINLLETLCEQIVALLFDEFHASWVRVSIVKAGVIQNVRRVGVCIEKRKDCGPR